MKKTNQLYVLLALVEHHYATTHFDLWMSKGAYDVFAMVIIFLCNDWQPKHVTIDLFEATKKKMQTLDKSLTKLLDKYGFRKKNIVYIKDEGSNFNAMTSTLKYIVNCESLGL